MSPGYGLSDKPRGASPSLYTIHTFADVVENLLEALGVSATHVLAHDVGDTVAQELLARHNARQAAAGLTGGLHCHVSSMRCMHSTASRSMPNHKSRFRTGVAMRGVN